VSPETCWAIKKHWNNKFYYTVAFCWFFLWDFHLQVPKLVICILAILPRKELLRVSVRSELVFYSKYFLACVSSAFPGVS
jgi:hypothetical protein